MRFALLAALLVPAALVPSVAHAQAAGAAPVRGKVLAAGGDPVPAALVEVLGSGDSARTSASGDFVLPGVPLGVHTLRIRALGFQPAIERITVRAGDGWAGEIVLEPVPQPLPEVTVRAPYGKPPEYAHTAKYDDYFRRRALGIGTFRSREDIEAKASHDLVSALQLIPGVRASSTANPYGETEVRLQVARCPGQPPNIAIYVDGRRYPLFIKPSRSELSALTLGRVDTIQSTCEDCVKLAEALSSILLRDVEFIEFYRGPGQIPAELDPMACAALVIWTR